jgi:hypothetical protein
MNTRNTSLHGLFLIRKVLSLLYRVIDLRENYHVLGNRGPQVYKWTRIRYGLAVAAIIIGFVIVRVSINGAWIIRENIVSCLPEELSEMFDQEQVIICSNIQSQKSVLLAGVLLGAGLAIAGFIIALVGLMEALMGKNADETNLHV